LFLKKELFFYSAFLLGFIYGYVFAARYGDIIYFFPVAFYVLLSGSRFDLKRIVKNTAFFSFGALLVAIPVLIAHKIFYGDYFLTYINYATSATAIYFHPWDIKLSLYRIYEIFFFPFVGVKNGPVGSDLYSTMSAIGCSFISSMPFILFFPAGL
jgi:hypothetical protein